MILIFLKFINLHGTELCCVCEGMPFAPSEEAPVPVNMMMRQLWDSVMIRWGGRGKWRRKTHIHTYTRTHTSSFCWVLIFTIITRLQKPTTPFTAARVIRTTQHFVYKWPHKHKHKHKCTNTLRLSPSFPFLSKNSNFQNLRTQIQMWLSKVSNGDTANGDNPQVGGMFFSVCVRWSTLAAENQRKWELKRFKVPDVN